ncbi:MAG: hypothetical protein IJF73_02250 [Clostridia bacterium]|nr:hypothetical protein [Clostridia bacterium]
MEADLTGAVALTDVEDAVRRAVAPLSEESIVRVVLTGALPPEAPRRDTVYLDGLLRDRFYHCETVDKTRLLLDPASYEGSVSLKGEFIRRVKASALAEDARDAVIAAGLSALRGEEIPL